MSRQLRFLVTGIADEHSLALTIARNLKESGAELVCAGLGQTAHHTDLSEAAQRYLANTYEAFQSVVAKEVTSSPGKAGGIQVTRSKRD